MEARENECQISQNYILHMKFSEFYHSFSRAPIRNFFFDVTTDDLLHL